MSDTALIVQIGDLIQTKNDKSKQLQSSDYQSNGILPIVDQGSKPICGYTNDLSKRYDKGLPVVIFGDHTLHTKFIDFHFAIGADGTQVLTPKSEDCDTKYLYYLISRATQLIGSEGYKRHFKILKEFDIEYVKPLPEQKKIAAILSSVDEVIEKTRAQIDKLKDLKTGMMQELLTKGIGSGGVPHTEFKDSPVGRIPAGWSIQRLLRFALNEKHSFVNGPFGSDLLSSELTASGVPVIYVRDLKNSKYDRVSTVCVTEGKADSLLACNVIKGDILVAKVGDPPCNAGVYEFYSRAIVTQDVIRIRPSEEVDPYFFAYLLNSPLGRSQIEKIEIAGTRKRVSLTEFKNLLFPMPPPKEQVHIGQTLRSVDNRIYKLEQKNAAYTKAKKALMQDLLTGKVRVQVDTRELAKA